MEIVQRPSLLLVLALAMVAGVVEDVVAFNRAGDCSNLIFKVEADVVVKGAGYTFNNNSGLGYNETCISRPPLIGRVRFGTAAWF